MVASDSVRVAVMTSPQAIGLVGFVLWLLRELGWFGLELTIKRHADFETSRQTWEESPQLTPQQLEAAGWSVMTLPHVQAVRCYCRVRMKCSPFRWVPLFKWGMSSLTRDGVVFRDGVYVCHVRSTAKVSMTSLGSVSALEYRKQIIKDDGEFFRNWMKQYAPAGA